MYMMLPVCDGTRRPPRVPVWQGVLAESLDPSRFTPDEVRRLAQFKGGEICGSALTDTTFKLRAASGAGEGDEATGSVDKSFLSSAW